MKKSLITECLHSCSKCLLLFVVVFIIGGCSQLDDYVPDVGIPPSTKELTAQEKDVMSKMFKPNKSISLRNALEGLEAMESLMPQRIVERKTGVVSMKGPMTILYLPEQVTLTTSQLTISTRTEYL